MTLDSYVAQNLYRNVLWWQESKKDTEKIQKLTFRKIFKALCLYYPGPIIAPEMRAAG